MIATIEYRTIDKSGWPRGAWDDEPDKVQWPDGETGLPCLIVRNGSLGNLCGYVGLPPGHPWYGLDYDSPGLADGEGIQVHGGLTFAGGCSERGDVASRICHIPAPGEPDEIWWLGFDCAHWRDCVPGLAHLGVEDVYRDRAYVERECASLARQIAAAA